MMMTVCSHLVIVNKEVEIYWKFHQTTDNMTSSKSQWRDEDQWYQLQHCILQKEATVEI